MHLENKTEETKEEVKAPKEDQFGISFEEEETGEGKEKEEEKDKGDEKSAEVVALETKLQEYSTNLSGQGDVIKKLQDKISALEKGGESKEGAGEENVLFKDIKTSKDLTEEQREDMTETEIALFDANARQQEAMNKMFETINNQSKQSNDAKVDDLNSTARVEAIRLAEEAIKTSPELAVDSKELSDKIIVEFNEFNNEGLTAEKLIERMKKALNNVNGYTPPKEQETKTAQGKNAVKDGAGKGKDPFGVDAIVASVKSENKGDYSL